MPNTVDAYSWKPTKKWLAAAIGGLLTIVVHAIASGAWDTTEWGEVVALLGALGAAYTKGNDPTPGGVPAP